jgi:hypothetical protein
VAHPFAKLRKGARLYLLLMKSAGGWSWFTFFFHITAAIGERIRLLRYSESLRNEGAPRVGVTRGCLYLTVTIDPVNV